MLAIRSASIDDIPIIQSLSRSIWNKVYPSIISQEQIEFMLNMMYSNEALTRQLEIDKHTFVIIYLDETPVGFASFSPKALNENKRFKLHKLYVEPAYHGKGLGKQLLLYIANQILQQGGREIELNVNKRNPAIQFYKHFHFEVENEVVLDIGNGYVMDDYIMVLDLAKNPI